MNIPAGIYHPYETVIHHMPCADGFGAAWAYYRAFGGLDGFVMDTFVGVQHGKEPTRQQLESWCGAKHVLMLDFSYPEEIMDKILELAQSFVLIDHHATAWERYGENEKYTFPFYYDVTHSGAVLTWKAFHGEMPVPKLLQYVEDRDLWKWALPHTMELTTALWSYPMTFESWDDIAYEFHWGNGIQTFRAEGEILLRARQKDIARIAGQDVQWVTVGGYLVPAVNTTFGRSEVGNTLCVMFPEAPFSVTYEDSWDETLQVRKRGWHLRSVGDFDVRKIAQAYGGGGHKNAAGFAQYLPKVTPPSVVDGDSRAGSPSVSSPSPTG